MVRLKCIGITILPVRYALTQSVRAGIIPQDTKATSSERPAPGGGPGTLTIVDNRTGKKYDVKVHLGLG